MTPTGAIQTRDPKGGPFLQADGVTRLTWDRITRWEDEAERAGVEFGVAVSRILPTVVIESGGDRTAVQQNLSNGNSYGLMQVVPYGVGWAGWHARVKTIAGLPPSAPRSDVIEALHISAINLKVGCSILSDFHRQYGSWDKASSAFFLGNPDWRGQDTVNGNTGEGYRRSLDGLIDEYGDEGGTMPNVRFAGAGVAVPLDVPFRQVLIPTGQTNQRPGTRMTPDRFIQHETANTTRGANAAMHLTWLQRGAPDDRGRSQQLGFHFAVDDTECIQLIPLDEIAWHGGDGSGPCNMRGLSSELCVNSDGNKAMARANAEKVAAAAMLAMNLTRLDQHNACSGKDCPQIMRREGYWPTFANNVRTILNGTTPPSTPAPVFAGLPPWLPAEHFKAAFPLADPNGAVTKKVIEVISEARVLPLFVEKRDVAAGKNLWVFNNITLLNDGPKVWVEGEQP